MLRNQQKPAMGFIFACTVLFASGCATVKVDSDLAPDTNMSSLHSLHVTKLPEDERGIEKLIETELRSRGFEVSSGDGGPPGDVDAVISYADKWMWDITMYMLELKLFVKDPNTDFIMGSAYSYRTSLARKSPEDMVKEVLDELFSQQQLTDQEG